MIKQVIVLRKDLNMRKGKMVAQGAHASMSAIFTCMEETLVDDYYIKYLEIDIIKDPNNALYKWLSGSFTKICVSVDSEAELLEIYNKAKFMDAIIPSSLIKDNGTTEFNGVPTYTAVAIGPADSAVIDKITGELKLL